jgi:hypothetical protein
VRAHGAKTGGRRAVEPHRFLHQCERASMGRAAEKRGEPVTASSRRQPRP